MPINEQDYFVRFVDFPKGINCGGMTMLNSDGTYSVYINSRMGIQKQRAAMKHELKHIQRGDLHCCTAAIETQEDALND